MPNANNEVVFLGPTAGKLVKKTDIPVLIVPEGAAFASPKKALFAFKRGRVKGDRSLAPINFFQKSFATEINLLLVKTPEQERKDQQIDHEIVELSNTMMSMSVDELYQYVPSAGSWLGAVAEAVSDNAT